jgi:FkbM family methyltransferase
VFAFEPLPEAFDKLERLASKWENRILALNVGLSDVEGQFELKFGDPSSELASFSPAVQEIEFVGRSNTNSVTTRVTTLDTFMEQMRVHAPEVDLLKIDVEGLEWEVLLGAKNTIVEMRPKLIQIEFNLHQLFVNRSILQFSRLLEGYRPTQILPYRGGLVERDPKDSLSNFYSYSNYVFVRSDFWSEFFSR